jgi:hypothetical protein
MVNWGPWSTLIPSVWSLKDVEVRNYLPLLRHRLKTLSDGANDRSRRRRIDIDARPRVGARLTLALLLALA